MDIINSLTWITLGLLVAYFGTLFVIDVWTDIKNRGAAQDG